jgi:muconolactone delta-isomerase
MLYLVTGKSLEQVQSSDPKQVAQMIETSVIPSLESMVKLEKDGKIVAGGLHAGARVGVAIVNAESNEELSQILRNFPFWGMLEWTVTPLETFEVGVRENQEMLKQLKSMTK